MQNLEKVQTEAPPVVLPVSPASNGFHRTPLPAPKPPRILRRMDTMQLVELGSRSLRSQQGRAREFGQGCEIIEEEPQTVRLSESSSGASSTSPQMPETRGAARRPSSAVPNVTSIVRRFLMKEEDPEGSSIWWSPNDVWNALREEPGRFRYAVWIKSAFLTSAIVLVYTHIRTLSVIHHLSDLYARNREKFNSNLDGCEECLIGAGWKNGFDSIDKSVVVKVYHLIDAILLDLNTTAFVGYMLGTAVGLRSLVTVLIQHKRLSLAISEGLRAALRQEGPSEGNRAASPWASFQQKYPILDACVFLAILCSTAVVQLHIIGVLSSVLLGLIINYSESLVLMDEFGYYILAYLLVFVIERVIMHFLKTWLISSDGERIQHPRWFNFFMVVLSMVCPAVSAKRRFLCPL